MLFTNEITGNFTFQFLKIGSNNLSVLSPIFSQRLPTSMEPVLDSNSLLNFKSKLGTLEEPDFHNSDSQQLPSKPSLASFQLSDLPYLCYYQPPCVQSPSSIHSELCS